MKENCSRQKRYGCVNATGCFNLLWTFASHNVNYSNSTTLNVKFDGHLDHDSVQYLLTLAIFECNSNDTCNVAHGTPTD
ncbi:CLUMA_CG008095, isoform A [Clunio marinus]|uniref:CLUMA_CG008095, isoform A n=1 Tax=Clunio marinus TaxID=568069 RepID=A0A1J1I325_9DIPT|nr:CLUMA_CG008095, isoform A [Clunio marinus]